VKSAADKAEAARLAKSVKGVKQVDNALVVQPE
jgi:osmotically-inducible protein OsmY